MPKIVVLITNLIVFFLFEPPVFAANVGEVVINEFSSNTDPEWVEIYNKTDSAISLAGWKLKDAANPAKDISSLGEIAAHGFKVYEVAGGWLNNTGGDTATLLDDIGTSIDSISYGHTGDPISTPSSAKSAGRQPDGSSAWVIFDNPTKGSTNDTSMPASTPSPSPSPSPTQSPSTKSTKSESSTKSPSPTPKRSPSPSSKSQQTEVISAEILGQKAEASEQAAAASPKLESPSPTAQAQSSNRTKIASYLAGSGLIVIGLSVALFLWYHRNLKKKDTDES